MLTFGVAAIIAISALVAGICFGFIAGITVYHNGIEREQANTYKVVIRPYDDPSKVAEAVLKELSSMQRPPEEPLN